MHNLVSYFSQWIDSEQNVSAPATDASNVDRINWFRCLPFLLLHLACIAVWWVGWSGFALCTALGLYVVRMFAITGIYHRYFPHRHTGRRDGCSLCLRY
jgi:stearoyl-CoA desaturase (Delta-9 desaturase)